MKLPQGSALFRVCTYELLRQLPPGHPDYPQVAVIRIRVKHDLAKQDASYLAIPEKAVLSDVTQARGEFVGEGDSEEAALEDCIAKLTAADFANIFPRRT